MRRGDIVTVAVQGDFGKPRPALVVQADEIDGIETTLVCLFTSNREAAPSFRYVVAPAPDNGLHIESAVMIDKITMVLRGKCGAVIGRLSAAQMAEVDTRLAFVLGLGR
ncbi:MAG: growth inhibitor PemK [Chelatococcus sp.]|nr:MAG: growth inhibitor PemK [Chelatococcus sp.]